MENSRIEHESNRNCDRRFNTSSTRARLDLRMEKIERVHIFLESSSNRNCDRRFSCKVVIGVCVCDVLVLYSGMD